VKVVKDQSGCKNLVTGSTTLFHQQMESKYPIPEIGQLVTASTESIAIRDR
jgi:hypothetical protein